MVLFNDTQPPKPPTLFGKILTWALRLVLLVIVLIAFFIGALNLLQGNGDTQRRGIEKTVSSFTNKDTYIGKLHSFALFPEFILEFDDLKNGLFSDKQILVDSLKFKAPGALVIKKNGIFKDINVENISLVRDNTPVRVVSSVNVVDEEGHSPHVLAKITAPSRASLTIPLERVHTNYRIKEGMPFSFEWAENTISGRFFSSDGQSYMTGEGKAHLPSLLPFLTNSGSNITCFIARSRFKDYTLFLDDVLIKTESSQDMRSIPSIHIDLFSKEISYKDLGEEDAPSKPYEENILLKSNCAS